MIDGVVRVCHQCGGEVSVRDIVAARREGDIHVLSQCPSCQVTVCEHVDSRTFRAIYDALRVQNGEEPLGVLSAGEEILLSFRRDLDEVFSPEQLLALWGDH